MVTLKLNSLLPEDGLSFIVTLAI